jgi:DNA-binding SARP family transcriptional activator
MQFRLLGPLVVTRDDRPVALTRAKQRALLEALLLQANAPVSVDALVEAIWGQEPPATATTALHGHVSALRKLLAPDTLVTEADGYSLRVAPGALDLDRFEELRAEARGLRDGGDAAAAATALRAALGLWRGRPLGDLDDVYAAAELARLEEVRLATVEDLLDAELELGRHGEAVGELEALVRANPFRERARALLLLALYRGGRQAEALQAYQDARRALVDELGIEPGPGLQQLHRRILEQDPSLNVEVASTLQPTTREVRKTVTILACASGTDLGDPEALQAEASATATAVRAAVERHGGAVERTLADVVLAVFGAASANEDDPLRALRAAAELRDGGLRVGVATGTVIVGAAGVVGEPVVAAQRLQLQAAPGEVLVAPATERLTGHAARIAEGRLLAVEPHAAAQPRRVDTPLVGRTLELAQLAGALEQAGRGARLVVVAGAAGVGKSRLVAELLARDGAGLRPLTGRCVPYGEGFTYWPAIELVRQAVGCGDADPPTEVAARLDALLGPGDDAAALAALVGAPGAAASTDELFHAVRRLLEQLAAEQPLVVVLEDMEHAEATLLDLVEHLADWAREVPLLLLCLTRPELLDRRPALLSRLNATLVAVEPLPPAACDQLLGNLLGGAVDPAAARVLAEAADGNPLFLEQLAAMLVEEGLLHREADAWRAPAAVDELRIPPSIELLLAARLDRLAPDEVVVLEAAAVEGAVFHLGALEAVLAEQDVEVDAAAATSALVRAGIVLPAPGSLGGEQAFRFRHGLIQDVAYERIPKALRARLHRRHARWLEQAGADRVLELDEAVGFHLERAFRLGAELGTPDEALAAESAAHLDAAGRRAHARGDFRAAAGLLARAHELYDAADPRAAAVALELAAALRLAGRAREALALLEGAAASDEATATRLELERCSARLLCDPSLSAADLAAAAESAIAVFERLRDDAGLAHAYALLGEVHLLACREAQVEAALERALVHARRAGDRQRAAGTLAKLALAAYLGPHPADDAILRCGEIEGADDADPTTRAVALAAQAVLEAMRGRADVGRERIAAAVALCEEYGLDRAVAFVPGFAGCVELAAGDAAAAEANLRVGYEALHALGESPTLATTAALLALALEAAGRLDEADALTAESERAAGADIVSQLYWRQARARVRLARGDRAGAEQLAREAVALAEPTDLLAVHGALLLDLAAALPAGPEQDAAVARGRALLAEKGDRAALARRYPPASVA